MSVPDTTNNPAPESPNTEAPVAFTTDRFFLPQTTPAASTAGSEVAVVPDPVAVAPAAPQIQETPAVVTEPISTVSNTGLAAQPAPDPIPAPEEDSAAPGDSLLDFSLGIEPEAGQGDSAPEGVVEETVITRALAEIAGLEEAAPVWQREALRRVADDAELSQGDKELIVKLHPSNWDRMRKRTANSDIVSKIRQADYPVEEKINQLKKISPTSYEQIIDTGIEQAVASTESLTRFAETKPETYKKLMIGLAMSSPDTLASILSSQGYRVTKALDAPVQDVDSILNELRSLDADSFAEIEGTSIESRIKEILSGSQQEAQMLREQLKARAGEESTDQPQAVAPSGDEPEFSAEMAPTYTTVVKSWESDFDNGLSRAGLVPQTKEQLKTNPRSSVLRQMAYNTAKHGYGQELSNWFSSMMQWGQTRDDFDEVAGNLTTALREKNPDEALSYGRSASGYVDEFASLRAQIPLVKTLLAMAKEYETKVSTPAPATSGAAVNSGVPNSSLPAVNGNGDSGGNGDGERVWLTDKLFLGSGK